MITIAHIDSEGEIVGLQQLANFDESNNYVQDGLTTVRLDPELVGINPSTILNLYFYRDGEFRPRDPRPSDYHWWRNYQWVQDFGDMWGKIKQKRQGLLFQSDWTQAIDSPLSEEKRVEWRTYRQALRDLPSVNADAQSFDEINWPTEPS